LGPFANTSDKGQKGTGLRCPVPNALGASEHFAYDVLGNLIAQKDRKNQVTTYTYDNMNRPLSKATGNTSTTGNLSTAYTYDTLGNVLTMTDGADVTTYDYTGDGLLSGITTPDGESISYTYNDAGYLTGVTDYSGYNYTYTYGGTGDVTGITQKENSTTVSSMSMYYTYPGVINGWMINHSTDGSTDKFYYYDDKGRVTKIDSGMFDFVGNENYYIQQNYVFDPVGNITQKTTTTDGTTNYTYDALNRIASETVGTTSTAYSYDANNNIVQKVMQPDVGPATIKSYTYDGANRISKETVTFADDITETTFGYDANGNMLYKLCNNSAEEFAYDAWNRLTEYTSAGGVETTYTYNGDNRRTSKTTGNSTINYYWDRDYVSMETVGTVTNTNFVTPMGIVSRIQDEDYTFLIRDAHGDVVERFTNGERDTYSYDAYGNEKTPDSTDDNPLRYCGEYFDTESGLIYLRNRYYDPELGRFINEDPHWNPDNMIYGDNNDSTPDFEAILQSVNLYAYCMNNPIAYVDSSGEFTLPIIVAPTYSRGKVFVYNRAAAVEYAKKHNETKNPNYPAYGSNCANYVSQCLFAGGLPMDNDWKTYWVPFIGTKTTREWDNAAKHYQYFKSAENGFVNNTYAITAVGVNNLANSGNVQMGDLIYFSSGGENAIYHAAIIVRVENGEIYYMQNSGPTGERPASQFSGNMYIVTIKDDRGGENIA